MTRILLLITLFTLAVLTPCLAAAPAPDASPAPATPVATGQPSPAPALAIQPTFIDMKEMTLAGIATFGDPSTGEIPKLWEGFFPALGDGVGLDTTDYSYGLELYPPSFPKSFVFTYMACYAVSDSRQVALSLVTRTIPAAKYAVFTVTGGVTAIAPTFHYIYSQWLPNSNYEIAFPFDMERYHLPEPADSSKMTIDILLPVRPKSAQ